MKKICVAALIILAFFSNLSFAQDSATSTEPVPYGENEFPTWAQHLRRTEIITLGSLPFVTLGVTLGYSVVNCGMHDWDSAYFGNPFTKSTSFTEQDQINILITSSLVAVGIGLTNLTINLIKDQKAKKTNLNYLQDNVKITARENELTIMPVPEKFTKPKDYLYGNIESAVF